MYAMFTKPTGVSIIAAGHSLAFPFSSAEACISKASRTRIGIDERRIGKLIVKQTRDASAVGLFVFHGLLTTVVG